MSHVDPRGFGFVVDDSGRRFYLTRGDAAGLPLDVGTRIEFMVQPSTDTRLPRARRVRVLHDA